MPLTEMRSVTPEEVETVDWKIVTKQEGQIRVSPELHQLGRDVLKTIEEDENGIAVLVYDHHSDAYNIRSQLRNVTERLSGKKIQTRIIQDIGEDHHVQGAHLYVRFRPEENVGNK